jgi:molecular chaperone DnaK (HSP70)
VKRVVGIDLGTTHSALAEGTLDASEPTVLGVEQWVARGQSAARPLLPSFLFHEPSASAEGDALGDDQWLVGELARARGREVPLRLVSSAKSWLCHAGVDRTAAILPWGSELDDLPKLSPVNASARILRHLARAWEKAHPGERLSEQLVVLTVPASFDDAARELTVRAAGDAGLVVRLLEEPQAAFYDFLAREGDAGLARICPDAVAHVLVCDIGGGTTDLSLIRVSRTEAGFDLSRVAVGKHLLLGGDNIDLSLSHHLEARLLAEGAAKLDAARFMSLVQQSRAAKEALLAPNAPESQRIAIAGSGSALVGQTKSLEVTRKEVEELTLGGFFPSVTLDDAPVRRGGAALVAFGLPYERDAAITRHVAEFLRRHLVGAAELHLDAVLYNGGPFRSARLRRHLHDVLESALGHTLREIDQPDPDLSVARGAVAFGRATVGLMPSIASGSAHGYYVGVAATGPTRRAVCVVPRGSKEGERHRVDIGLSLTVDRPARFELYATDAGPVHAPGEVIEPDEDFLLLPPIATHFSAEGVNDLAVALEGELSALGTVDLACVATEGAQRGARFRLAFELRGTEKRVAKSSPSEAPRGAAGRLDEAYEAVQRVFGKGRKDVKEREAKDLLRTLERLLGERREWTLETNRALYDVIGPLHKSRRRSADHERMFFLLASYCLRPGVGHALDPGRVALIASTLAEGLAFPEQERTWQQLFIAWRRLAAGLDEALQTRLRDQIDPFLAPASAKLTKPKSFRPMSLLDALEAASWLERVPVKRRAQLAEWVLERTWTDREPRLWAALGRLGTRVPLYASAHHVLPARHAEELLDHLMREPWDELRTAPLAATLLARRTDDRSRDVNAGLRSEVAKRLEREGARADWVECVREVVPPENTDQAVLFGEELPVGLVLRS